VDGLWSVNWTQNATTVAGQANGASGSSTAYLNTPEGIFISSDDTLYIADGSNNRIVSKQLNGNTSIKIIGSGPGNNVNQFNYPSDVFSTDTTVYVADSNNSRVQKWSTNGTSPMTTVQISTAAGAMFLFVDQYDGLYVSQCSRNLVERYTNFSKNATVAGNGIRGSLATQLGCPLGIFVDGTEALYVADWKNNRIQKWNYGATFGTTVAGNGTSGVGLTTLSGPKSVIVDTNGYMYIVDTGNNRLLKWPPNATTGVCIVACTGGSGIGANQLNSPVDLAFDSNGSIYVSDHANNRIQKFQILNNPSKCPIINDEIDTIEGSFLHQKVTTVQTTMEQTTFHSSVAVSQQSSRGNFNIKYCLILCLLTIKLQ
jgi:sugar lactone lactonase YvrE